MKINYILFTIFYCFQSFSIKDKYCGDLNCFEILGLTQGASPEEIKQAFRQLSKTYHPDKAKQDTTEKYRKIIHAYEILSNEETKAAYLDFLKNPQQNEVYNYYRYYQSQYRTYLPHTNPFLVSFIFIIFLSIVQYSARYGMYKNAVSQAQQTSYFKRLVNDKYEEMQGKQTKDEVRDMLLSQIQIKGSYSKPYFQDIWFISLGLYFWDSVIFNIYFTLKWRYFYKNGQGMKVSELDADKKTQKLLHFGRKAWRELESKDKQNLIEKKLWIRQNWIDFQQQRRLEYEDYLAKNQNKIKQAKRWTKKVQ